MNEGDSFMWAPAADELGRVYYYHTQTDDVQWENPLKDALQETQEKVLDIMRLSKQQRVCRCVHIGLTFRLRRMFARWSEVMSSTQVETIAHVFNSWMLMKESVLASTDLRDETLEEFHQLKLRCSELEQELICCKLKEASFTFDHLRANAKITSDVKT